MADNVKITMAIETPAVKHFKISIVYGRSEFSCYCATISEAVDIIRDAAILIPESKLNDHFDDIIHDLVKMKFGDTNKIARYLFQVEYE